MDTKTLYTPVKENGLGLHKVADLWGAVKISWLRRLTYMKPLWKALHIEEVKDAGFDPINYNLDTLEKARKRIKNPVWAEIYDWLKKCGSSVLNVYPEDVLTVLVVGEPDFTKNEKLCWS